MLRKKTTQKYFINLTISWEKNIYKYIHIYIQYIKGYVWPHVNLYVFSTIAAELSWTRITLLHTAQIFGSNNLSGMPEDV